MGGSINDIITDVREDLQRRAFICTVEDISRQGRLEGCHHGASMMQCLQQYCGICINTPDLRTGRRVS